MTSTTEPYDYKKSLSTCRSTRDASTMHEIHAARTL